MVIWSLVLRSRRRWSSASFLAPTSAASALFLSLSALVSLTLRSFILFLATTSISMAAMHHPSSCFHCLWASSTHSSTILVVWIAFKEKKKDVKVNSLRAKITCTLSKDKELKNLPWPSPFSRLETPHASLVSSGRPYLKEEVGAAPKRFPCSQLSPSESLK